MTRIESQYAKEFLNYMDHTIKSPTLKRKCKEKKNTSCPSWQVKEQAVQTPAFPSGAQVRHEKIACLFMYPLL